ncbi:MAG: response regulator transcription factor [Pseudomonadota bacterium]
MSALNDPHERHRVLVVDDQTLTAKYLANSVVHRSDLELVGTAFSLAEGLTLLNDTQPRIVLVDLGLPDGSGLELLKAASRASWPCDGLVVTVFGDEASVFSAIRAGARGYILKSSGIEHIGQQIAMLIEGGSPMSPIIARSVLSLVANANIDPSPSRADAVTLTPRESEVLSLIARGYKRAEIATMLAIAIGTVGNHINSVYRKLEVRSNTEAVAKATQIGVI